MKGVLMRGEKKRRVLFEIEHRRDSRIRHNDPKHVEFIRWQIGGQSIGIQKYHRTLRSSFSRLFVSVTKKQHRDGRLF